MPKLQKPAALPSVAKHHLTIDGPYRRQSRHPRMMMWPSALVCVVVFAMMMWHVVASAGTATAAPAAARLKAPATQPLPASTPTKPPRPQPKPSAPTKPSPSPQRQAAAASRIDARRKAAIKAVKTCQRQLAMDDDTYRAMLQARTGKRSATELTLTELGVVLDHLRQAGASHGIHADGRKRKAPAEDRQALYKKVCALLAALAKATGKPYTMSYADAICVRNGWCSRIDFANAEVLHRVVAALSRNLSRTTAAATAAQG